MNKTALFEFVDEVVNKIKKSHSSINKFYFASFENNFVHLKIKIPSLHVTNGNAFKLKI